MSFIPIYEKDLQNSLCDFDTIGLSEYNNYINDTGYTYSGITLVLDFTNFTTHFDTTGHTYSNVILNNDVYTYTGLTGETHYFYITQFYSGGTLSIDPLLTGMTESDVISGFTTSIISCREKLDGLTGTCCPTQSVLNNLPWVLITNTGRGVDRCEDYIERREHLGWTLDYVFNRSGQTWTDTVFFYTGVRDEYDPENYVDNNLSFRFTDDGRIKWSSFRYSGYCNTVSGYTPVYYLSTGQTMPLCTNGTSDDFNITITFERYYEYSGCSLANEGGWNDLIHTGLTSTTGSTIITGETIEQLSNLWLNERKKRLGTLKLYHNGRPLEIDDVHSSIPNFRNIPVYKVRDFEEIVLSDRGYQPFTHVQGGGVTGSGGIHEGVCCYTIKDTSYFDFPIQYIDLRDRYLTEIKPYYNIIECNDPCADVISIFTPTPTRTVTPTPTSTQTPTPTSTQTPTPTQTPTQTPTPSITPSITPTHTVTPSPTPTISYQTYTLGYDISDSYSACTGFTGSPHYFYAPLSGGTSPDVGEILYWDSDRMFPAADGIYSDGTNFWIITGSDGLITSGPFACLSYDDWFLPTSSAVSLMFTYLKSEGVGDFADDNYWSSFEGGSSWAFAYDMTSPGTENLFTKDVVCRVRASRLFIGTLDEYFIRDVGPAGGLIYYIEDNGDDTYTYHEAAPFDQSTGCTWSNIINIGCNTTNDSLSDGISNTQKIISQVGHISSAAKLCDDLIITV